jgi:hypothetical protein
MTRMVLTGDSVVTQVISKEGRKLARPEGYAPTPSLAGARLRQLPLSKIVPYDFVEPATTWFEDAKS